MNYRKIAVSAVVIMALCLAACNPAPPVEKPYPLPDAMKHCKVYKLYDGEKEIRVVYCPKVPTITSYTESCGKNCVRTVTTSVVHEE